MVAGTRLALALGALLAGSSCTSVRPPQVPTPTPAIIATAVASPDWATLETPLQLPVLDAGASCPHASGQIVSPAFGAGLGDGPVYPIGLGAGGILGVVVVDPTSLMQKVLWVASSAYAGPVLLRGGRLGTAGTVKFGIGNAEPQDEFRLTQGTARSSGEEDGWREWPSYTFVPALGCYAYQVDGVGFTKVIVFEAKPA